MIKRLWTGLNNSTDGTTRLRTDTPTGKEEELLLGGVCIAELLLHSCVGDVCWPLTLSVDGHGQRSSVDMRRRGARVAHQLGFTGPAISRGLKRRPVDFIGRWPGIYITSMRWSRHSLLGGTLAFSLSHYLTAASRSAHFQIFCWISIAINALQYYFKGTAVA